jgi:hypothetical protein
MHCPRRSALWFTPAYNVVGIVMAATGWLHPVAAAAAQSLPDVVVLLNSSRLLGRGNDPSRGRWGAGSPRDEVPLPGPAGEDARGRQR